FQAEDGIRDLIVTGVQTCALPISWGPTSSAAQAGSASPATHGWRPPGSLERNFWPGGIPCGRPRALGASRVMRSPTEGFISSAPDRKSTRLNSSHDQISYAVFCLK